MGTGKIKQGGLAVCVFLLLTALAILLLWYLWNFYGAGFAQMVRMKPEKGGYFGGFKIIRHLTEFSMFTALCFVHLLLFAVERSCRINLYFSLLCSAWSVRSGLDLFPIIPQPAACRLEYLTLPAAFILFILLARSMFPGIVQKGFVRAAGAAAAVFTVICLMSGTTLPSWARLCGNGMCTAALGYLHVRFLIKLPGMARTGKLHTEHAISLIGFVFFLYAGVRQLLHYPDSPIRPGVDLANAAMIIFSFTQMTAIFYGATRETVLARRRQKRAETEKEMLSEMNRLKNSFYTDMSHEMKTTLTVIAVNAQFAAQSIRSGMVDQETVTDLNAISAEARRLAQMVTSFVGIGRMQGTQDGMVPLGSLLTETARIYQSLFARKNNTLTVEAEPDLPPVKGNADRLIQVVINLLSNANRHTAGGCVLIRAEALEDRVLVSVTDSGEGIAGTLLPHVFERFCHSETGGFGLGLPICRTIIEEHGGEIGIESEEGRGTRVWFTLPVKEAEGYEGDRDDPAGGGR